jgi:MinD-like ATPase involved in chromosome partitioning or flagellar assembly/tetratricopeptide (TPR) repeat protein
MPDLPVDAPQNRDGQIVTFYSYKGGTGRTMALANVAWILAANGRRVLVADWDLESPGLHRFFHPFLDEDEVRDASGIIDLIRHYEQASEKSSDQDELDKLVHERARIQQYALSLKWGFTGGGSLDFLSAGRQNLDYVATLAALDWDTFYERLNGGQFLDAVRADMKRNYDYVLIDSRTGLSDVADICTVHLPDILVDCFTLSIQGIEGAAQVARLIEGHKDRGIRILPVPMRVDQAEKEKVEAGHKVAVALFAGLPAAMSEAQRRQYWAAVEVPYRAFYAYEETLAVFGDPPGSPTSLLSAFERLTAQITDGAVTSLPPVDEQLRNRTKLQFARRAPLVGETINVEFSPEDQVWGEWIAEVLRAAEVAVSERFIDGSTLPDQAELSSARTLTVVSAAYLARHRAQLAPRTLPDLAVYVTATRQPAEFSSAPAAFIAGVPETDAIERLHRLIGISNGPIAEVGEQGYGVRFPGTEPKINTAPVHNMRFTGREDDLRRLREQLRDFGTTVVLPVTLQGLGGVGKTQVAIEYVHRFKTDYDLIWWLDCGQPQFIDASLADLGTLLRDDLGAAALESANAPEAARQVLQLLEQGKAAPRWLLVFDNAEEIDRVKPYLPSGGGDVLITSRNRDWADQALPLQVEVFTRAESVAHLRKRVPSIGEADADKVAELLGDLPLAVATAGAWLAETGVSVSEYLIQLERRAPRALSVSHLADYPQSVSETWDLSLIRLRERSAAAARLFELCSVMAPSIALDLLHSSAMASVLEHIDPELAEPMVIGRLIREIDRLALIKLDHNSGLIHVHRLVQTVVQDRMSPEQIAAARRDVQQVLAAARPSRGVDNPETWDRFRQLWPHLAPSQAMKSAAEPARQLFLDRVRYIWHRSALEPGRELAVEVEAAWEEMLAAGPDQSLVESLRRQLLHLRFDLANILRDQARFTDAKALDEKVLEEQQELLGFDHPHALMTAGGLAADLRALGSYREALDMDKATYPAWTELYGEGHPRTLMAANNLAVSYRLNGDVATALRMDEDTLLRRRTTLGRLHPHALNSASNVIRDLLDAGRYAEAAGQMEVVQLACVEALGADSLVAHNAEVLLGTALRRTGQPAQAEPHFLAALTGLTDRFGDSSSDALIGRLSHAVNLLSLERAADAEEEIRAVRSVYEVRLGPSHPHTLVCLVALACALRSEEHRSAAMQTIQSAAGGLHAGLGESHPYTLAAMAVLGVLLADQGDLDQAEKIESQAFDRLTTTLGPDHPDTLRVRANLLLTRQQRGNAGAGQERARVINELTTALGADHPHIEMLRRERRLLHTLDPQPF